MNASITANHGSTAHEPLDSFDQLEAIRRKADADVVVFRASCDPFLPSFLRCLGAAGELRVPDACSEFRTHADSSLRPVSGQRDEPAVEQAIAARNDPIFGDFARREGLRALASFEQSDPASGATATLAIGYRREVESASWEQISVELRREFDALVSDSAATRRRLAESCQRWQAPFIDVLAEIDRLAQPGEANTEQRLKHVFERAVAALDVRDWCGTVRLLDDDGVSLSRAACLGECSTPAKSSHQIDQGEGVTTWAALRRQPLCIPDLSASAFGRIHVEQMKGARSLLVVPLVVRGAMVGTLSLESPSAGAFDLQSIGYLWRVAELVVTQMRITRLEMECGRLHEVVHDCHRRLYERLTTTLEEVLAPDLGPIE